MKHSNNDFLKNTAQKNTQVNQTRELTMQQSFSNVKQQLEQSIDKNVIKQEMLRNQQIRNLTHKIFDEFFPGKSKYCDDICYIFDLSGAGSNNFEAMRLFLSNFLEDYDAISQIAMDDARAAVGQAVDQLKEDQEFYWF